LIIILVDFPRSQVWGLYNNNYLTWLIRLSYLGGWRCNSTRMMAFLNTKDPWIDYLIISRLGGCYATPIIQFFYGRRFKIKIDPQLQSVTWPKARGLLHMECDFAIALLYNLDFKTDEMDHLPASWQFKYYWRLLQAVLEDAQELLEEFSRLLELLLSTTMCAGACWAYTPGTHTRMGEDGFLLELSCNPTRTCSV
jgi:hypothetical protein